MFKFFKKLFSQRLQYKTFVVYDVAFKRQSDIWVSGALMQTVELIAVRHEYDGIGHYEIVKDRYVPHTAYSRPLTESEFQYKLHHQNFFI